MIGRDALNVIYEQDRKRVLRRRKRQWKAAACWMFPTGCSIRTDIWSGFI